MKLWPHLDAAQRHNALGQLTTSKPGAKTVVTALKAGTIAKTDLDGPTVEKLQALLGANDPDLASLLNDLAALFRPVLTLNGNDDAWTETGVTLEGPFTVETWVRLAPGIDNNDGILGVPGQLDINFYDAKLRVWVGGAIHDAIISKKPMTADLWTHVAVTRDDKGFFKIYQDGELTADQSKSAPQKFENVRIAWTAPGKGTAGALSEFRIWKVARTADEIRRDFDRTFSEGEKPSGLILLATGTEGWGKLQPGAKITKTSDYPPVMSAPEARALDEKFAKYRALSQKPGDPAKGKLVTAVCQACHLFKGQGASIGPDLSGVGAMGDEAILRNIITPNAAMENGYRIYRMELKSGDLVEAFYVSEDKDAVVIRQPGVPDRRIPKADLRSAKYLRRSLMPEGLLDTMTPEQVSDLFAYLRTMK
jgi:putative heme-binding domain-containing protein